jgi:beta-galactosidase
MSFMNDSINRLLTCLLLALSLLACEAQAGENILKDGGFEQYLDQPDELGNPFKVWAGWKWEGNCRRAADRDIKHEGQASAEMLSYGACKLGISQTVKTEAGWYRLSGYVRAISLTTGLYDRGLVVSFEPKGKELMTDLPTGTYGWRKFELTQQLEEACDSTLLYLYLFGSGKVWLDELRLEKLAGTGFKNGLVLGEVEETLHGFRGPGGLKCPSCGLGVDGKAAKCAICGEPLSGVGEYAQANKLFLQVAELISQAKEKGVDVAYWQAAAIPMRVGLNERWNNFPEERPETLKYVEARSQDLIREIGEVLAGKTQPRHPPPKPDFTRMKLKGRNFCEGEVPTFVYSVHSGPSPEAEPFFSRHTAWVYTCMALGADRFNYKEMPIWETFNQYPDTHRVWDGGWCGHIIADKWSGGVSGANCVICLESSHTREACIEAYRKILPPQMQSKTRLISLLDYEYFYICYCDLTRDMFRGWLKEKFGIIEKLNQAWDTRHKAFAEVQLPDFRQREPNDAKRYDWLDFNLWRFTQFLKWAKAQQRQIDPGIPMATCAPHYNFSKEWGESGSDVEALTAEVNDFCINESPASTEYVDFLRSLSDNRKAIVEVEGSEYRNTMASFLHGLSALSLYWGWADKAGDGGALLYGRGSRPPYCTLPEAERFLRTGLDIRRLRKEIVAFQQDIKAPVALLYSKASLLQVPEIGGDRTPYLLELERTYNALLEIGVPIDFITTRQVLEGKLPRYQVLVIPAATYEQAEVVQKVMDFAKSGGQVVLVPNSWFFDQYNRKQDYLAPLGIQVSSMRAPKIAAGQARTGIQRDASGEETEAPFLMGLIVDSVVTEVPKATIKTAKSSAFRQEMELQGAGVRHVLKVGAGNRVLATFPHDQPAIVQVPMEKGSIYYLAIPLVSDSMVELMDGLLAGCGAQSPIRFLTPEGKHVSGLEYRAIKSSDGYLAFVNNLDRKHDQQVRLTPNLAFSIRNLTLETDLEPSFVVPAGETYILKLKQP